MKHGVMESGSLSISRQGYHLVCWTPWIELFSVTSLLMLSD